MNEVEEIRSKLAGSITYMLTKDINVTNKERFIFKSNAEQWLKDIDLLDFKLMKFTGTLNEQMAHLSYSNMITSKDPVVQKIWKLNQMIIRKQQLDKDFE